jgi:hypothetical protein
MSPSNPGYQAGMKQIRAVAGRDLTPTELRDLDLFLTSYAYTQGEGADRPAADNENDRRDRVLLAGARAVGVSASTVAYSGVKALSQNTGVDLLKVASFGEESAFGKNTSQASLKEVWSGLSGVLYGLRDVR